MRGPWSMLPDILPGELRQAENALTNPSLFEAITERKQSNAPRQFALSNPQEQIYVGSPERIRWRESLREDDQIVNLVPVVGVITRNFNWWSWSGVEIRDNIMRANEDPLVQAHLLYLNTPGGESSALYDVKLAIDNARSRGIPVYGLIDGMACSLGCGIAAMCDKVFFLNPEDKIGSVGVYWSFWGAKPGATDSNGYTHVEIYDEESYDKNKEVRDALEGDSAEALALMARLRTDLTAIVKSGRPSVIDEQLHGKVYRAADVVGTFVDGQSDLLSVAMDAVASYNPTSPRSETINTNNNPKTLKQMKLEQLCNCLGVESLAVDEEKGCYIQESQLELMENHLVEQSRQLSDEQIARQTAETQVSELNTQLETARTEHAAALEERNNQLSALQQELETAQTSLNTANERVSALETENETLAQTAGAPAAVEQPQNNNDVVIDEDPVESQSVIKSNMSMEEKAEAIRARKQEMGF